MRGPLLSGPLGSTATLERIFHLVRERAPTLVLSALWLAEALTVAIPVVALVEPDKHRSARRLVKRLAQGPISSLVVVAGEDLPVRPGTVGAIVVERIDDIENDEDAVDFLAGLLRMLRPQGLVIALDATKSPIVEARIAGLFLAAPLVGITQERPREGAVLTVGKLPTASIR